MLRIRLLSIFIYISSSNLFITKFIGKFNQLVYNYPIRIPERFSLVIRSLLTQEGICFTLQPDFKFLEVAYPYVAKRLLTDPNPALRERLIQVTSQGLLNTTAKLLSIGSFYHMIHHCICESVE
jgi:predicted unusual protein kinase regulating ubiquinone biosynthesis (AarF/ABC1/UbiB family)